MSEQIYDLINKVMKEVPEIPKLKTNQGQGFKFRGIEDVLRFVQPALCKHGVFVVPEVIDAQVEERTTAKGGAITYTTLTMNYHFCAPDGSRVTACVVGQAMDSGDKSANKAMSAAMKYALLQTLAIPTEAMEDPDEEAHEVAPKRQLPVQPKLADAPAAPAAKAIAWELLKAQAEKGNVSLADMPGLGMFWKACEAVGIGPDQAVAIAVGHSRIDGDNTYTDWQAATKAVGALADRKAAGEGK